MTEIGTPQKEHEIIPAVEPVPSREPAPEREPVPVEEPDLVPAA